MDYVDQKIRQALPPYSTLDPPKKRVFKHFSDDFEQKNRISCLPKCKILIHLFDIKALSKTNFLITASSTKGIA